MATYERGCFLVSFNRQNYIKIPPSCSFSVSELHFPGIFALPFVAATRERGRNVRFFLTFGGMCNPVEGGESFRAEELLFGEGARKIFQKGDLCIYAYVSEDEKVENFLLRGLFFTLPRWCEKTPWWCCHLTMVALPLHHG